MYNEISKKATMKYIKENRELLGLRLPIGTKDEWKQQAKAKGYQSLTVYITELIEKDKGC